MSKPSPMMEQYRSIKEQHPDKLLFFQVGDFFELFYEDAGIAAREMDIALTSRGMDREEPIPLAGVPIHAAETYLNKLLARGHKVVICEQVEESSQARGLVKREITRILTPGTITDPRLLEESRNNYLAAVVALPGNIVGLAAVDVSTGDFKATEKRGDGAAESIFDELNRLAPSECICSSEDLSRLAGTLLNTPSGCSVEQIKRLPGPEESKGLISSQWGDNIYDELELQRYTGAALAASSALQYLQQLQHPRGMKHFHPLELYFSEKQMIIDPVTARNLELTQSYLEGTKKGSLLHLVDHCVTGMGKRLLRRWLEQPLLDRKAIEERHEAVEELLQKPLQRDELRRFLQQIIDLERFSGRLSYRSVNARDLVHLKNTLSQVGPIKTLSSSFNSSLLQTLGAELPAFKELIDLIGAALVDEPPPGLKEGGLIRTGYNSEVDNLKKLAGDGSDMLLQLEQKEKERTGIKSLRVGYNRNFGYYFEITRANLELVPAEYQRRQTLVNAERFTMPELEEMENRITGARDKLIRLEYSLFEELRERAAAYIPAISAAADSLAGIDCLQGFAETADKYNYCRPRMADNNLFRLKEARHPVVEALTTEKYVPNDIFMDEKSYILLITGPNMAGKSTYIRSAALASALAQAGSFVPAGEAQLPILDRIFARVGAGDDLSRGHSTFMVEMQETAAILCEATDKSLVILDEIGRGTSTYDGMSIARSVIEYIGSRLKAKTLFSTHYHELTNLEGDIAGIKNYTMAVKEKGKKVIFLRKVVPGKADKSYGINVARLAGIPLEVLIRAEEVLAELELKASTAGERQLSLLPLVSKPLPEKVLELEIAAELKDLDLNRTTPMEAIQKLFELQSRLIEGEKGEEDGDD